MGSNGYLTIAYINMVLAFWQIEECKTTKRMSASCLGDVFVRQPGSAKFEKQHIHHELV